MQKKNEMEMYLFEVYLIHLDFTVYFSNRSNFLFVCVKWAQRYPYSWILIRPKKGQDKTKPNKAKTLTKRKVWKNPNLSLKFPPSVLRNDIQHDYD